jgi:hypothetical protein
VSRYSGYPSWFLPVKLGLLLTFLPAYMYLCLCNSLSFHYQTELERYDEEALTISDRWLDGINFNDHSICVVDHYFAAGADAANYPPFDAWWMIRNWKTDFLAKQPSCNP